MVRIASLLAVVSLGLLASAATAPVKRTVDEIESCIKVIGSDIDKVGAAVANFKKAPVAENARAIDAAALSIPTSCKSCEDRARRSSPFSSPEAARIGGAIDIVTGRLQTAIDALIVVRPQLEKVVEGGVNLVRSRLTLARDAESSFGVALVKLTPATDIPAALKRQLEVTRIFNVAITAYRN